MKFFKWFSVLVVVIPLLLVGGIYIRNVSIGPEGWAKDDAIKALKKKMRDPDSMIVRSSYTVKTVEPSGDTQIVVCGIVDGKNGFGGFSRGTRFVSVSSDGKNTDTFDTYIVEMDQASFADRSTAKQLRQLTAFEDVYWNKYCIDETHPALVFEA